MSDITTALIHRLLENNDEEYFDQKELETNICTRSENPRYFEWLEANPPEGAIGHFCRFAAQSYSTVYKRRATYVATKRQNGKGVYWRLVSSGYGPHPHLGSTKICRGDDTIELPK